MTTTPLFTPQELDAHITAFKSALLALTTAEEYTINFPDGTRQTVRRPDLQNMRDHLKWLQSERVASESPASALTQAHVGRPAR